MPQIQNLPTCVSGAQQDGHHLSSSLKTDGCSMNICADRPWNVGNGLHRRSMHAAYWVYAPEPPVRRVTILKPLSRAYFG